MIHRRLVHGVDLRKTGVVFVHYGGDPAEATRRFDVSLWCVRDGGLEKICGPAAGCSTPAEAEPGPTASAGA